MDVQLIPYTMTTKTKYENPSAQIVNLEFGNSILTGSTEGGGGNENYAPIPSGFEDLEGLF